MTEVQMLNGPNRLAKSGNAPKQLVVLLHGYGSNGDSMITIGDKWSEVLPDAEFIAPNGIESTKSYPPSYQWFEWINFEAANVRPGLEKSAIVLTKVLSQWLVERERTSKDLVLVGFSQGMMVTLELMFHIPGIHCVIGYSGAFYPPQNNKLVGNYPNILLIHGDADRGVPYSAFQEAGRQITQIGLCPRMETRQGLGHQIDDTGLKLGANFLKQYSS